MFRKFVSIIYYVSFAVLAVCFIGFISNSAMAAIPELGKFFKPVPDISQKYAPDKIYPQGRIFPFSAFSVGGGSEKKRGELLPESEVQAVFSRFKKDNFTMAGPQYELNDRLIADAKKHGLKAIYSIGLKMNFYSDKPVKISPEDIKKAIKEQVSKVVECPEIAWWNVSSEELRYWRKNEMEYLEILVKTIRETDPYHRPIWMYEPGHRNAEDMAHIAKYLDVVGKGFYVNYTGQRESRIWVKWSVEQEIGAIEKANSNAIPIAVPEMFKEGWEIPRKDFPFPQLVPKWVRHDVYLSLISGVKGIIVFSMSKRENFPEHETYYKAYAQTANEICGKLNLGQVFLFGEKRNDINIEVLNGPKSVIQKDDFGSRIGGTNIGATIEYPSVNFLDVAHGTDRYLFAVNSANEPVLVMVGGLPDAKILVYDVFNAGDPMHVGEKEFKLKFEPLEVKCMRFAPGK
ncbi:MAG: hypothetical protein Q7J15_04120 [Candidatus Desulfaltia sp.]|nr:hypothetical protein [Candidatus Desulfaltia sp.]